jgi:oligoendopeptidase F
MDKAEKSNLLGELPEWDLDDLYPSPDSKRISEDIGWLKVECKAFASDYEGKLSSLTANNMLICIRRYEKNRNGFWSNNVVCWSSVLPKNN